MRNELHNGDSGEVLRRFPDGHFDATVTDPPYGLGTKEPSGPEIDAYLRGESGIDTGGDFMGKSWDIPSVALWREVYRTMREGGVLMAFAGTRTLDLMAAGIGAAGFRYVGTLGWCYGSGFPKSLNIGKAIDKAAGVPPDSITVNASGSLGGLGKAGWNPTPRALHYNGPKTLEAQAWQGWGTALKPSWEPVLVFTRGDSDWKMPTFPFLYCAKAAKSERNLEGEVGNDHVTVKPVRLMEWLVELAVPKKGLVLEPFLGSGTTAVACASVGRDFVGIERDPHYYEIASKRVGIVKGRADEVAGQRELFDLMADLPQE